VAHSLDASIDFRAIFEAAPGLYLVLAPDLTIVAVSDAYARATMTERNAIVGRNVFEVFPDNPDDPAASGVSNLRASLDRVREFRQPDVMAVQRYDIRRPASAGDGFEEHYWSLLNAPVLDGRGQVAWIVHRVEDVTELMRAQSEGADRDRIQRDQQRIIDELRIVNQALAQQIGANAELHRGIAERSAALQNEIAERQKAEDALGKTTKFLDTVVENLPGMLFVKDAKEHRFVLFNRAGEALLGYDRSELIGKNDYDFFPKDQADQFVARDREMLAAGKPTITPEEPITTRHQGTRILRTVKVPVLGENGEPQFLLGFSEDITERKAIEQQLHQALKIEAVGQLTGGVSHDFNNLLTVIVGSAELLEGRSRGRDPTELKLIANILKAGQQGAELTRRLLAFARRQPLQPRVVNINEFVVHVRPLLQRTLGEHIDIGMELADGLWGAEVDPNQVEAAVLNLAINARDAMAEGGHLMIETANVTLDKSQADHFGEVQPGSYVTLSVSDDGSGMAPDVLARAIEPFFTTKSIGKGPGLGLSMVYGFAKQSLGHMTIYSEAGHGTTVRLYLPRALAHALAVDQSAAPAELPTSGGELILVVEDDTAVRQVAVDVLKSMGYEVLEAGNGKQAIGIFEKHGPVDLLFTDVIMPGGMSGPMLAAELKRRQPGLRVLYTSGYTENAIIHQGRLDEGVLLLNKPYRRNDLSEKIRVALTAPAT
jgi:PAS domain S-box-containing protein